MPDESSPETYDVLLIHSRTDTDAAHEIAVALVGRGLRVSSDAWTVPPQPSRKSLFPGGRTFDAIAVLLGRDDFELWSTPYLYGFLSQWRKSRNPLIPVLLPGASGSSEATSAFFDHFAWVDLRDGITDKGLDHLEWGITGTKPNKRPASRKRLSESPYTLSPEEVLQLAFDLVAARRAGPDLLLHLDAARLEEAMENVPGDRVGLSSKPGLRNVVTWLVQQVPDARPDPLWQKWMLTTQRKTLEDLAAALSSSSRA